MLTTASQKQQQEKTAELLQLIKKRGKKELDTNPFFTDLNELMRHDNKFRIFYDKYCKDSSDVKTVLIYMKLYETLELEYKGRMIEETESDHEEVLICAIKELMTNESTRKSILSSFNRYFTNNNSDTKYVLDILQQQEKQQKQIEDAPNLS
jgi:hypothetical protein